MWPAWGSAERERSAVTLAAGWVLDVAGTKKVPLLVDTLNSDHSCVGIWHVSVGGLLLFFVK